MAKKQQPKVNTDSLKKSVKMANPQVALYPKGQISIKSVDSLRSTDPKLSKMIGNPMKGKANEMPKYGTQSSDVIKKFMSKSAVKPSIVAKGKKK